MSDHVTGDSGGMPPFVGESIFCVSEICDGRRERVEYCHRDFWVDTKPGDQQVYQIPGHIAEQTDDAVASELAQVGSLDSVDDPHLISKSSMPADQPCRWDFLVERLPK